MITNPLKIIWCDFVVNCGIDCCAYVTKTWASYKMHVKQKLGIQMLTTAHIANPVVDCYISDYLLNGYVEDIEDKPPLQTSLYVTYLLSLEADHNFSRRRIDSVLTTTADLLKQQVLCCKQDMKQMLCQHGIEVEDSIFNSIMEKGFFDGLETAHRWMKFYSQFFQFA